MVRGDRLERSKFAAQAKDTLTCATNFYLAYLGLPLLPELRRNAAVLRKLARAAYPVFADVPARPISGQKRRVAIFSASLNAHSVSRVWSSTLLALPSEKFQLAVFYPNAVEDASTANWRARVARFEGGNRPVETWIAALRAFAPDIVFFPDTGMNRIVQGVAALRHAPVQIAAWGHPVTTGLETIDYFLSADACEPVDGAEHYSERLLRLPRLGSYLDPPTEAPHAEHHSAADRPFRFLCTQSADKLHPGHDALFAFILAANPSARLDILCSAALTNVVEALATRLREEFARHGIDFDSRCRIHPRLPPAEYRRFLDAADACLDSLAFSGGITSLDALWRNLPIVTLPGAMMRGRQSYGMLKLLHLDELIATDLDDYVRIATRLAQDAAWREVLVQRINAHKRELYQDESTVSTLTEFLLTVQPTISAPQ